MSAKREAARLVVLVIYGGRSAEHEISIISARFIVDSLDRARFEPLLVGIDPGGGWHLQREEQLPKATDPRSVTVAEGPRAHVAPMPSGGGRAGALVLDGLAPLDFDVAFPVLHGPMGEDGCIQGLFELAGVPYVGAGVAGSAVGMDKVIQKQILAQAGIAVLPHVALRGHALSRDSDAAVVACEGLGYPLFVKPANMGSSLGVRRAHDRSELALAIAGALELDTKIVVERGLVGAREIEVAVLGNDEPEVSIPGEIRVEHSDGYYSYEAKYLDDGARLLIPAELEEAEMAAVQRMAARAFLALDTAGMARVDLFMSQDRELYVNEINTIPGFTAISMYPRLWQASGLAARDLVTRLIELGLERWRARRALRTRR